MRASVYISSKQFGGYEIEDFTISIVYEFSDEWRSSWEDLADGSDFATNDTAWRDISAVLLGKRTDRIIKGEGGTPILYKGEVISKLHLKTIREQWEEVSFTHTRFSAPLKRVKLKHAAALLRRSLEQAETNIAVTFRNNNDDQRQSSASLTMNRAVAYRLGKLLLEASTGSTNMENKKLTFRENQPSVP